MKIGIVTTWFERGAAYVSRQYMALLQPEHEVSIYARGFKDKPENSDWDGSHVHWGKPSVLPVAMAIDKKDFIGWIKKNKIEVVFFNEQQWWPPVLWAREAGAKTGAYVDYYTEETIPLFESYDFLICNTKRHFEAFNWHKQCYYIPWGTDVDLFKPRSLKPVGGKVVFFQSCGYSPLRKGTDFVIKAFSEIKTDAKLLIHTQTDLNKAMPDLAPVIRNLMSDGRLEIIFKTVQAPGLYHLGDVYVAPSRLEGIGLTAAEAIASGLPFITTDFPPMNEFVTEQSGKVAKVDRLWARKDGYYWPQCRPDIDSLTEAMTWYAERFSDLERYKLQAFEFAQRELNWNHRKESVLQAFTSSHQCSLTSEVGEQLNFYERSRNGIRMKMAMRFPFLYKMIR